MRKNILLVLLFVVLSIFATSNASATLITYEFSGSLYYLFEHDDSTGIYTSPPQSDLFGELFSIGDTFTGHFTYETDAIPFFLNDDVHASYLEGLKDFQVNINDYTFSNDGPGSVSTGNDAVFLSSLYDSFYISEDQSIGNVVNTSSLFFMDSTASFTNDILIPENLDLSLFNNSNHFKKEFLDTISDDQLHMLGTLETLTRVAPVPEPSTMILFSMGVISLAWLRRKE